jgi:peptide/nickel transport system ATP-binding protein
MKLLELNNFSLELKQDENWNSILSSLSFSITKGEIVGVVGESGSGKSVTALSIMQLLSKKTSRITQGAIICNHKPAMIFQEPMTSLNPVIKCGKQVTEAILLHTRLSKKAAQQKAIELFADVQLPNPEKVFHAYPYELSGGQKQRVMIAMAMSRNPDILIADEPTTALDVTVQKNILELLKSLQEKNGMSILFISHDLGVIAQIAQRVIVMRKGEIVEQGDVKAIFKNPQHSYTKALLACRTDLEREKGKKGEKENLTILRSCDLTVSRSLFQIENLSKCYPIRKRKLFEQQAYFQALENINLTIYEGETLGLVGESGCGKTTLGRTLLRLIEPDSGTIHYKDVNLRTLTSKALRKLRQEIQIVLQDPYSSLNQRLTIGQILTEPMQVHHILQNNKERRKRAIELLECVGLNETHLQRYPHEFSGGQRQRIVIARALTVNPKFIICDESVSALDVSVQAQVLSLLNDLKQKFQLTYLFISHDLSVVKYMSDRIAVMQCGRIVELNDAESIYHNPQTEYTQNLIAAIPKISAMAFRWVRNISSSEVVPQDF